MIDKEKEVIFTDTAKIRLEELHIALEQKVIDYLREKKNVPGDDFIEATASDLDEIMSRLRIIRYNNNSTYKSAVLIVYSVVGTLLIAIGILLPRIKAILSSNDRFQLLLITAGLMLLLTSLFTYYIVRLRERRISAEFELETRKALYDDVLQRVREETSKIQEETLKLHNRNLEQ